MKQAIPEGRKGSEAYETGRGRPSHTGYIRAVRCRAAFGGIGSLGWMLAALFLLQCTRPVQVGERGPDFVLKDLDGGSVSLGELRGKVVFLHFWATWCPPCLVELPGLVRFVRGLDRNRYVLLAVCVDNERPAKVRKFVESWGTAIPVYLDPGGSLARRYGTVRFPETYVLDVDGRVCNKVIGPGDWNTPKWARILHTCARQTDKDKRETEPDA
jgi:peroxiredoxin